MHVRVRPARWGNYKVAQLQVIQRRK